MRPNPVRPRSGDDRLEKFSRIQAVDAFVSKQTSRTTKHRQACTDRQQAIMMLQGPIGISFHQLCKVLTAWATGLLWGIHHASINRRHMLKICL